MLIAGIVLLVIGIALAFLSRRSSGRATLMKATETSRIGDLVALVGEIRADLPGSDGTGFTQFVELKGQLVCEQPIVGELSGQAAAVVDTRVERMVETRHEVRDSQGNVRTQWRKETETVSQNRREAPMFLDDGSGRVRVHTAGAKMSLDKVIDRFEPPAAVEQGGAGQLTVGVGTFRMAIGGLLGSGGRRTVGYRFEEKLLPLGRPLYALGELADTADGLILRKPEDKSRPFLMSLKSEDEVVRSTEKSAIWLRAGAAALGLGGVALVVADLVGRIS